MKKYILISVGLILVLIIAFLLWKFLPGFFNKTVLPSAPSEITYWGLDDENLVRPVIDEYKRQNPGVIVIYIKQSSLNYRTRVQTQIRAGVGPDVFAIHNSWLKMFDGDLAPAPPDIFSVSGYRGTFYPVALDSFSQNGQIYAASSGIDGLGLFVNEDILNGVGAIIPKTWREFVETATKVTVKNQSGKIQTAGAALGTTINVDFWPDILGLLMLEQPGVDFNNLSNPQAAEVLRFYTGFVTNPQSKTWDIDLPSSTQMFVSGRLAFYFAPSSQIKNILQINPNLKFKVVSVPQLGVNQVGWASFWGQAVSQSSKNPQEAWKFVKFLTSQDSERLVYNQAIQSGVLEQPYSRLDLASDLSQDPILGAFVNQGPFYKFWYLASNTGDKGINDEMIKYFGDGINATLAGITPETALQTVNSGVKQVLQKYTGSVTLPTK